jgi:hypothetical protein
VTEYDDPEECFSVNVTNLSRDFFYRMSHRSGTAGNIGVLSRLLQCMFNMITAHADENA